MLLPYSYHKHKRIKFSAMFRWQYLVIVELCSHVDASLKAFVEQT